MKKLIPLLIVLLLQACATQTAGPVNPDRARLSQQQLQQALNHFKAGQLSEALLAVADSIKSNPDNAQAHHVAALIYQRRGETGQAREHFETAIRLAPNDPVIRNNYGNFLCSLGKYTAADENFLLAAKQAGNPKPEIAWTNAGLCAVRANQTGKARDYFKQAIQNNPGQLTALFQLAKLHYQNGKYIAASTLLEQYAQHGEDTAKTLLLKAQIEQALGNLDSMEKYKQQLRARFPNSPEARKASELINARTPQPIVAMPQKNPPATTASDTDWILSRQPTHYTLQILATADKQAIDRLVADTTFPGRAAVYGFRNDGRQWYNLVVGDYPSLDSARAALQKLPQSVRALNPWVRRFDSVQRVISQKGL